MTAMIDLTHDTDGVTPAAPDRVALIALQRWESDGGAYEVRRAD